MVSRNEVEEILDVGLESELSIDVCFEGLKILSHEKGVGGKGLSVCKIHSYESNAFI